MDFVGNVPETAFTLEARSSAAMQKMQMIALLKENPNTWAIVFGDSDSPEGCSRRTAQSWNKIPGVQVRIEMIDSHKRLPPSKQRYRLYAKYVPEEDHGIPEEPFEAPEPESFAPEIQSSEPLFLDEEEDGNEDPVKSMVETLTRPSTPRIPVPPAPTRPRTAFQAEQAGHPVEHTPQFAE